MTLNISTSSHYEWSDYFYFNQSGHVTAYRLQKKDFLIAVANMAEIPEDLVIVLDNIVCLRKVKLYKELESFKLELELQDSIITYTITSDYDFLSRFFLKLMFK